MAHDSQKNENELEVRSPQKTETLFPLPFPIQLSNTFAVEIVAKRFPIVFSENMGPLSPNININLNNINISEDDHRAQIILSIEVTFPSEPRLFEISFSILGLFTYEPSYTIDQVHQYLEQGSLSALLPFARELLASLCTRMQVPVIFISMFPVAPAQIQEE